MDTPGLARRPFEAEPTPWRHHIAIYVAMAAIAIALVGTYAILWKRPLNSILVRNMSGSVLEDVTVRLSWNDELILEERIPSIAPGESHRIPHRFNDSRGELTFVVQGERHSFASEYIDLWTGETWVFEVRPGHTVADGHSAIFDPPVD